MKETTTARICPKCGKEYKEHPALSREDNLTEICPDCGAREALETVFGLSKNEKDRIIEAMHRGEQGCNE